MAAKSINNPISKNSNFPVAGVGASAGGLDAFKTLIKAIPDNSGIAWVLAQHQHPTYESMLTDLLQKITTLPVTEITNNLVIQPNNIYVLPANKMLAVKDGKLKLTPRSPDKTLANYPINIFFESLAQMYQDQAIGIFLSGTASDGTKGLKAIKDHGGITMCQTVSSAAYKSMPESAIEAAVVDFVLAPDKIPKKIIDIKKVIRIDATDETISEQDENSFKQILALLHKHRSMDFTYYKQSTVRRRILRRMVLNKYKKIADYTAHLKDKKSELDALYQDMLIPVTGFFRDEKVFNNLCETVFPNLIKNKPADGFIRIWVAGCSTGEEAYSIAICFHEYLGHKKEKVQIFATDLSESAIAKARAGIYSKADAEVVSHHRLKKFFTPVPGGYQVNKDLRDVCVFATHNFLKDPPFSKIDFISCRNVLIYMEPYLQKKALSTFHYALNTHGLLMLGKSENTIGITDLFITSNKTEKIFARKGVASKPAPASSTQIQAVYKPIKKGTVTENVRTDLQKITDDVILHEYMPAAVVVNAALDIVQFRGDTSLYLQQLPGKPTHNLLKMAKPGLAFEFRSIIHKAIKEKKAVKKENVPVQLNDAQQLIGLEAMPLPGLIEPHYLLIFNDKIKIINKTAPAKSPSRSKKDEDTLRLHQLEQELAQLREDMRSIADEQEATNEELQSSNEELMSSNEEMQSLNEELETSKEELQSTVEELTVVNHEMVSLNEQLTLEKEYAEAIIATIPQPMLVLDKHLKVMVANQQFYQKFLVTETETEGELIYNIGNKQWNIKELKVLLESILPEKESFLGFEVEHFFENIGHRIMRLNAREIIKSEGEKLILLAIEDITDYVAAARKIQESEHRYANMIYSSPFMIAILEGKDMIIKNANDAILSTWGKGKDIIGMPLTTAMPQSIEIGSNDRLKKVYETGEPYYGYEIPVQTVHDDKSALRYYNFIYQPQKDINGKIEGVAILASEVTPQAIFNKKIKDNEQQFRQLADSLPSLIWQTDATGNQVFASKRWKEFTGLDPENAASFEKMIHPDDVAGITEAWSHSLATGNIYHHEVRLKCQEGKYHWFEVNGEPIYNDKNEIEKWVGAFTNINERKEAEQAIKESEEKFRTMAESSDILIGVNDESVNAVYFNKTWEKLTGRSVDDLLNLGWADLLHPDDKEPFMQKFLTAYENKASYEGEFRMLNKEGTYSWLYAKVQVRLHPDGAYAGHISSCIDITERKENENALKESEEKTRAVIESSPFPIGVYMGKDLIIEFANQAILDIWGKGNNVIGKPYRNVLPELENQQIFQQFDEVLNTGKRFEKRNQKIDIIVNGKSQTYYFNYNLAPLFDSSGNVIGVMSTAADVTDLNLAKQKIEEAEEQFSTLADNMENLAWTADGDGWIYWYNKRWLEYTGLTLEEMQGWGWQKVHHPDHVERIVEISKKIWHVNETFELTFPLRRYDGEYRWFLTRGYPVTNEAGKIIRWLGTNTDITNQIETEQRLSLLSTIVESSGDAIISKTLNSIITTWNKGAEHMFGYTASEIIGKSIYILIPEELQQEEEMVINNIKYGQPVHYETVRRAKDGRKLHVSLSISPIKDKDGNITGASKIARDITEQVIARKKIEESETQFRILSDQAPMWVWLTDKALNILYANTELLTFIGIADYTQFTGHVWEQKVHPDELSFIYQLFNEAVTLQKPFEIECRVLNATTGLYEWFFIKGVPRYEADMFTGFIGTGININEQKLVLNQLEYRKALLEAHNEASLDGILLVDTKGKIISYNHRFIEIWNMPKHVTDAKNDEAALTFATTQLKNPNQFIDKVKWLYEHPDEISIDELEFKNGKIIERHGYPVKAPDGSYYAWSWIFRDISAQRKSEQTIKESASLLQKTTEHFELATTAAQVGTWSLEVVTGTLVWNDLHKKMWGYDDLQADLTYEDWHTLIITEDKEAAFAESARALKTKTLYEVSYRIKRSNDGEIRWIHSAGHFFYNDAGEPVNLTGISIDITDQKESEIALMESEKRFRLLADSMPQHVWTADTEGNLNYFNQSVFDYSGLSLEKIIQDGWLQIVHPDDREENIKQWTASVTTGKDFLLEHRFKRHDGQYRWQLSRALPQKDSEGNITMWVGASTDIQNLKEEEQRKTDFIKMVSHELKTPITSIKGYVQMLLSMLGNQVENDSNSIPVKHSLVRVDEQIKRLTRLITEMLDLTKLEESKLHLQKEKLVLNDLVNETVQDIEFTNKTHKISISQKFTGTVYVDKDRIQQVIINLVNNGIKYSPQKKDIDILIDQKIPGTIEVSVKDFGIGINQQEQEKIFDRFYRAEGKTEYTFGGFGIGLYIVREILTKHDGTIKVESVVDKGSVFTFTLPLVP